MHRPDHFFCVNDFQNGTAVSFAYILSPAIGLVRAASHLMLAASLLVMIFQSTFSHCCDYSLDNVQKIDALQESCISVYMFLYNSVQTRSCD